jgi:hypothetical protein
MLNFDLEKEGLDIKLTADAALSDGDLLNSLLEGLLSKDDATRYNCFETLLVLSKDNPEFLYAHWDYFQELLSRSNNYSKYIAVYILANLTAVDNDKKFDAIYADYFDLLGGKRTMISSHVALNSPIIAQNKPELRSSIVDKLVDIDNIHQGRQVELIKAYAIQALQEIYTESDDKEKILEFVKANLNSISPKTRQMAADFLRNCY